MAWRCQICGKGPIMGNRISRRGLAKKKGGVGLKTTGVTRRRFYPNLQKVRALVQNRVVRLRVCTKCLGSGKVLKPPQRVKFE